MTDAEKIPAVVLCQDCLEPMETRIPDTPIAKAVAEKLLICESCAAKARARMKRAMPRRRRRGR